MLFNPFYKNGGYLHKYLIFLWKRSCICAILNINTVQVQFFTGRKVES